MAVKRLKKTIGKINKSEKELTEADIRQLVITMAKRLGLVKK